MVWNFNLDIHSRYTWVRISIWGCLSGVQISSFYLGLMMESMIYFESKVRTLEAKIKWICTYM